MNWNIYSQAFTVRTYRKRLSNLNTYHNLRKLQPTHGGSDPGKISTSGVMEKDVNLSIAMALKQLFENRGFTVVMTRTTDCDLAPDNSKHPKTDDLTKRTALMSKSNVAVSISIHQNSYHEEAIRGGQVFYYKTSVRGKKLAESLQKRFDYVLGDSNKRQAKANDNYYLLLHVKEPIVIAECGFCAPGSADGLGLYGIHKLTHSFLFSS